MNNTITELQWGDVIFKPGQRVRTTDASDYARLEGYFGNSYRRR